MTFTVTPDSENAPPLLKQSQFAWATLDALSAHIALVGTDGTIVAVNRAWRKFAEKNSAKSNVLEGSSYFAACTRARGEETRDAQAFLTGLQAVLRGEQDFYALQYPCHSPSEKRWFEARVTRFTADDKNFAVVAHENVTERVLAEQERFQRARETALTEERQRLSRELHDGVTQTLFSSTVLADSVQELWKRDPDRAFQQLGQITTLNRAALTEMRTLLYELRPEALLSAELRELIAQLAQAMMGRKAIQVETTFSGEKFSLPPDAHLAIYRVVQEATNNIIKHSGATQASVTLEYADGMVHVRVSDNGRGFDPYQSHAGFGLAGIKERVAAIGATFEITSEHGMGTQITLTWRPT